MPQSADLELPSYWSFAHYELSSGIFGSSLIHYLYLFLSEKSRIKIKITSRRHWLDALL
jgi:hypothetical protein